MPASSMCCMTPPMTQRVPSEIASTSASKASSRKLSISTGCSGATRAARREVAPERRVVVDDLHRAAAEHVGRAHQHRIAHARGHGDRLLDRERHAVRRLGDAQLAGDRLEAPAVLREVDRLGRGAEDPDALALEPPRQPERRLPAELHDHADRLLDAPRSRARPRA